ncbi:type II toxin-antitoxin system HicB family antitoxin [Clostridium perfringens]|uniref:type II toxin-antitoxin system HicB family antitoxin n=1 Tax=Clostridium perfringens TaxID=1502 RepID=UPI00115A0DAA|nr:type II toxin-antitoxin system HicB family antitoxin [Clostridium perfringens]
MKKRYRFPCVLTKENDRITVTFPNFKGCISCGYTFEEAIKNGKQALGLHINGLIEDNEVLPDSKEIKNIRVYENQKIEFIEVEIEE